jgi:hypothetical protein
MEELLIPGRQEIERMSYGRSRQERLRLLNEIVFARDDESIGGAPHAKAIIACKNAIEAIDEHLRNLSEQRSYFEEQAG